MVKILCVLALLALGFSQSSSAMYWEDDHPSNDPANKYRKPGGCLWGPLFRGFKSSGRKVGRYLSQGGRPTPDRGRVLRKEKKLAIILASGFLGGTAAYITALSTEKETQDIVLYRATLTIAGVVGGLLVGVYAIPETMNTDPTARKTTTGVSVALAF